MFYFSLWFVCFQFIAHPHQGPSVKCQLSLDAATMEPSGKPNVPANNNASLLGKLLFTQSVWRRGHTKIFSPVAAGLCQLLTFTGSLTLGQSIMYWWTVLYLCTQEPFGTVRHNNTKSGVAVRLGRTRSPFLRKLSSDWAVSPGVEYETLNQLSDSLRWHL